MKLAGTYDKKRKREQVQRHAKETLGTDEADTLSKYTKASTHVHCDKCKLRIGKRSVYVHLTSDKGEHRLEPKVVAGYACVKDGTKIKNKHKNHDLYCSFERLITKIAPDNDKYDENGDRVDAAAPVQAPVEAPVEAPVQAPASSSCGPIDFTQLVEAMGKQTEALVGAIRQLACGRGGGGGGGGGGVAGPLVLPAVEIAPEAAAWTKYTVDEDRRRNAWPRELSTKDFDCKPVDIPEYRMYLTSTKHVKPSSITLYVQGVTYWRRLVVIPAGLTELEVFPSLWLHKNIRTLFSLPILEPSHATSHKIAMSLSHYMGDLLLRCDAEDTPYHEKLAKTIRLTFHMFVKPLLAKSKDYKKQRAIEKRQRESELRSRLQHYLPAIKVGIKNTFIDMFNIITKFNSDGHDKPDTALSFAVTVWKCGVAFLNSLAGRPGGWEKLSEAAYHDMAEALLNYMIAKDHKTVKTYGPLALHCPDGNKEAYKLADSLPSNGSGLFLEPPNWTKKDGPEKVYCTKALHFWLAGYITDDIVAAEVKECHRFEGGFGQVSCTVLRKWQTTGSISHDKATAATLKENCDINGQSVQVALSTYVVSELQEMADKSQKRFELLFGKPVPFPSAEECMAEKHASTKRYNALFSKFKSNVGNKGGVKNSNFFVASDNESDQSEDESEGDAEEEGDDNDAAELAIGFGGPAVDRETGKIITHRLKGKQTVKPVCAEPLLEIPVAPIPVQQAGASTTPLGNWDATPPRTPSLSEPSGCEVDTDEEFQTPLGTDIFQDGGKQPLLPFVSRPTWGHHLGTRIVSLHVPRRQPLLVRT